MGERSIGFDMPMPGINICPTALSAISFSSAAISSLNRVRASCHCVGLISCDASALSRSRPFSSSDCICAALGRSEEHTSELQSLMRISYAVFVLKKKKQRESNKKEHKHE